MAKKGFFKTIKAFSFVAAACLFAACSNLGDDYSGFQGGMILPGAPAATGGVSGGPAAQVTNCLTATVSLPSLPSLAGIAPVPKNVAQNISKSAFPNIADATDPSYSFSATLAQSGGATYSADGTYNSVTGTCSFAFAGAQSASEASYTLTVSLWHTDGTPAVKSLVASGSQSVSVAAGAGTFAASVSLAPNTDASAPNGSLSLPIKFSDTSVSSVKLMLSNSAGTDVTTTYLDNLTGTTLNLTSGEGTIASKDGGLPAGTYTLLMSFMKGTAQVGARTESLNIYPTMQTKLWWTKDGIGTAATALSVTQFDQKEFYVRGTDGVFYTTTFPGAGSALDTNNGSFAFPLKTIQEAVNRIVASGDTTSQFTIYIDGKIEGDPDADYSSNQSSLVRMGASSVPFENKILIKGWTGPDTDIVDVKKSKDSVNKARAFYISANSSAKVIVKDLGITHSAASGIGGAFYIISCSDAILENCKISECYAATSGGGIYMSKSNLELKNSVVSQNEAVGSGGGVYVQGGDPTAKGCLTIENSEISANSAASGGGVYVSVYSTLNFLSGQIAANTATYSSTVTNSGLGGGVYINTSGKCFISGAATIGQSLASTSSCATSADGSHSNSAQYGGGIYNKGELYLGYTDDSTPAAWTGSVCYNYASSDGGGILSYGSSTLVKMNAGSVAYNLCSDGSGTTGGGGGLAVQNSSAFTMSGGTVSYNQTNNKVGGGIYVDSGATLTLNGTAEVSSNRTSADGTGTMGGAGLFAFRGSIVMEGNAVVKGNLCKGIGCGVYLYEFENAASYASLSMSGNAKILDSINADGIGGAVYVTQRCSFSMSGAATIPAGAAGTTGAGKNDVYLDENTSVAVPAAITSTATPVATITPQSYTLDAVVLSGTALSAVECAKFAVTQPVDVDFPWELRYDSATGKGVLKQPHSVIYVASPTATPAGSDTTGNGSKANPYATIQEAAKHFGDKTPPVGGTAEDPIFENKIYILSDMTFTTGAGADNNAYYFEIVGCTGGTVGNNVTLTFDTPDDSGFYVAYGQKIKFTNIDITQSSATVNNYAVILVENSSTNGVGELWMEDCSIKNMYAKSCSAIAAQGDVHLKNVEISDNKTVPPTGVTNFGPAINSTTGTVSVLGKVVVQNNTVELDDGAGGYVYKEQNVWIGDNPFPNPAVFHPIAVAGPLADGSQIGVTTYDPSATVFTSGYTSAGNTAAPKTYFTSDAGMAVALTTSAPVGEAVLAVPTDLYVSGSSESPAGSDVTGNGSAAKPYASVAQAIMTLDGYGVATNEYTIHVSGTITENVNVPDGIAAAKITIAGTSAATDILDGVDKSGAVVTIDESAIPVDLKNLTITNGSRGVDIEAAATVNIEGCVITGNQGSVSGAGVYMGAGGSLTITDTDITQNIATGSGSGGGIYAPYSGSLAKFEMTGGSLSNNNAKNGGGASLACIQAANPLLKNVTISGNTATANGGGVYVTSGRYLTIEGCDISGNTATNGGGIYNAGGCNIKGSTTISANTATSGGAICAATSVTLGGGVYIPAGTAGANDVYLAAGALINVASELTATPTPVATITPIVYNNLTAVVALAASSTATLDDSIAKFAVTPNSLSSWTIVKDALGITGVLRAANSASGGISISISEGVAFVVAVPKKSGDAASFVVQDTSGASPVAIAADDPYIAIKQNGATVYSANAQSVGAPFLSPGSYQLYCRATVDGAVFDTTVPFGVGDKYTPLTLEAAQAGAVVTFDNKAAGPVTYRVNGGEEQIISSGTRQAITLSAVGDMVQFYGDNAAYGGPTSTASDSSNISCSKACYVYGNIMSLIKSSGFESETKLTASNTFKNLFRDNSNIYNKTGQSLLLPATTLAISCYNTMFQGCTSLTNAPELPATTLTNMCYYLMFQGCTSLTSAPALPATTLAGSCYYLMFQGCTSLTSAPALPATTLAAYCYFSMFQGCTSLNSVTCLATDISASNCTTNWLSGVAATGTFTKAPGMTAWTSGASGIPSGWTTQDAP